MQTEIGIRRKALIVAAVMLWPVVTLGAPQVPPSAPVTVVNTPTNPVPVTGTVNATLTGTPTINATITGIPAVAVVSDPFQQAYQGGFQFEATIVGNCASNQEKITVPAGRILVIDNVFVEGQATKGANVFGVLQVRFAGSSSHFRFSAPFISVEPPSVRYPAGRGVYDGNFPTKLVAQAGDSVLINGCTGGPETTGNAFIEVVVTGHFVAVP